MALYGNNPLRGEKAANQFVEGLGDEELHLLHNLTKNKLNLIKSSDIVDIKDPPTWEQLGKLMVFEAVPFVGFGFLDNMIMLLCGDVIEYTIGRSLNLSTLAAAGLGNTVSDVAGVASAWYVERLARCLGMPQPNLSPSQIDRRSVKFVTQFGRAFGVFVGCMIGMIPLIWMPNPDPKPNPELNAKFD